MHCQPSLHYPSCRTTTTHTAHCLEPWHLKINLPLTEYSTYVFNVFFRLPPSDSDQKPRSTVVRLKLWNYGTILTNLPQPKLKGNLERGVTIGCFVDTMGKPSSSEEDRATEPEQWQGDARHDVDV
uniref:Uncharacterized protein n=1 Tax=Cucumis melo TaxID=3656 RepID=A0A9I9E899_CUCME